jgi:aspartate/methionine/tyrosine aminotransferase
MSPADDRLVVVHSFSKSFLMTGWRLGWLVMPPALTPPWQAARVQHLLRAGVRAAGRHRGAGARPTSDAACGGAHASLCRDTLVPLLQAVPGVRWPAARRHVRLLPL